MIIVSDSSPLIYLAKTNNLELLKKLFQQVSLPKEVYREVVEEGKRGGYTDSIVIEQAVSQGWLVIEKNIANIPMLKEFKELDEGEKEAISLAVNKKADFVLLDDAQARKVAKILKLNVRGTIYVLLLAHEKNLLGKKEVRKSIDQLVNVGFRISTEFYAKIIAELE